jgi:hypothetical protein
MIEANRVARIVYHVASSSATLTGILQLIVHP